MHLINHFFKCHKFMIIAGEDIVCFFMSILNVFLRVPPLWNYSPQIHNGCHNHEALTLDWDLHSIIMDRGPLNVLKLICFISESFYMRCHLSKNGALHSFWRLCQFFVFRQQNERLKKMLLS